MFEIDVCQVRRIALVRFRGQVSEQDWTMLQALAQRRRGRDEYDSILDLTEVERSDVTTDFIATRGALPQVFDNRERIYVVPHDDLKLLVRLYAAYQAAKGWRPPLIVNTIGEAFAYLGVRPEDFQPVVLGADASPPGDG